MKVTKYYEYTTLKNGKRKLRVTRAEDDDITTTKALLKPGESKEVDNRYYKSQGTVILSGTELFVPHYTSIFHMLPRRWKVAGPAEHDANVSYDVTEKEDKTRILVQIDIPDQSLEREDKINEHMQNLHMEEKLKFYDNNGLEVDLDEDDETADDE